VRKKKHAEHVNHERWLVSYADFITLLFAFFVVMFAVSQVDAKKVGRFTESFSRAVGIDVFPEAGRSLLPGDIPKVVPTTDTPSPSPPLPPELEALKFQLVELEREKQLPPGLQFITRRNELVVRLSEKLLFDVGDDALKAPAVDAIKRVAATLAPRKVNVRVEGHTDDRPIKTARFRSNWDLSTARATAVVAVLVNDGFEPARLSAAGLAEFHPVAGNDTDEGRRQNRRVDVVVTVAHKETP
jgi:chemotaxis protein MotB